MTQQHLVKWYQDHVTLIAFFWLDNESSYGTSTRNCILHKGGWIGVRKSVDPCHFLAQSVDVIDPPFFSFKSGTLYCLKTFCGVVPLQQAVDICFFLTPEPPPTPSPGMGVGVFPDISYIGMCGMCDFKTGRSIESWRKFTADPRSSVFSKSAKPLNLSQKSAICTLFKVKPVDPQIYSPPLLLLLSWAKRTWNLFPFGTRVLFHPPRACHTLVCLTTTNSSRAVCKFRT